MVKDDLAGGDRLVGLSYLDRAKWVRHSDKSMRTRFKYLGRQQHVVAPTEFGDVQSRVGFRYWTEAIILSPALRCKAISTLMFDWPHIYLINGVLSRELQALIASCESMTYMGS